MTYSVEWDVKPLLTLSHGLLFKQALLLLMIFRIVYMYNCFSWCFRTDIPQEELDEIITSIHDHFDTSTTTALPTASTAAVNHASPTAAVEDGRLRNLRKKLKQIETLKDRQQHGEALEDSQVKTSSCYRSRLTTHLYDVAYDSSVAKHLKTVR